MKQNNCFDFELKTCSTTWNMIICFLLLFFREYETGWNLISNIESNFCFVLLLSLKRTFRVHLDAMVCYAQIVKPLKHHCGVGISSVSQSVMHVAYTTSCTTWIDRSPWRKTPSKWVEFYFWVILKHTLKHIWKVFLRKLYEALNFESIWNAILCYVFVLRIWFSFFFSKFLSLIWHFSKFFPSVDS